MDRKKPFFRHLPGDAAARSAQHGTRMSSGARGIHFEKPVSQSLAEWDAVAEAIDIRGVAISYGTTRRFNDV